MTPTHRDRIREAFTKQAGTFEQAELNIAFTSGLPWLIGLAEPDVADRVLDVAGGTGLVARGLAPHVRSVAVVDSTPAMLLEGRAAAVAEGHANVAFAEADARLLPFGDGTFSLVVTRFSLHHLEDPLALLDEAVRVTATGGRLVVKDLVSSSDPAVAERQDAVERLRDDSHVRMPAEGAVATWLRQRGCAVLRVERTTIDRPLEPWLQQSVTPPDRAERVRAWLRSELDGAPPSGMRPHLVDRALWFRQTWEATVALRL